MKRLLLLFAAILTAISVYAQLSELSVCGIKMGTEREDAKAILESRFGKYSAHDDDGNLIVYGGCVGGINYNSLRFFFAWVNGCPRFDGACLSKHYELSEQSDALKKRDFIKSIYEQKYDIEEHIKDDGFKEYFFYGINNDPYGLITVEKSKGKDGKMRIYVSVFYFGIYDQTDDI